VATLRKLLGLALLVWLGRWAAREVASVIVGRRVKREGGFGA